MSLHYWRNKQEEKAKRRRKKLTARSPPSAPPTDLSSKQQRARGDYGRHLAPFRPPTSSSSPSAPAMFRAFARSPVPSASRLAALQPSARAVSVPRIGQWPFLPSSRRALAREKESARGKTDDD